MRICKCPFLNTINFLPLNLCGKSSLKMEMCLQSGKDFTNVLPSGFFYSCICTYQNLNMLFTKTFCSELQQLPENCFSVYLKVKTVSNLSTVKDIQLKVSGKI